MRWPRVAGRARVCLALLLLGGTPGCSPPPEPAARPPVIVVGIDGLDWTLLMRYVKQGLLPTIRDFLQRGSFGRLETLQPTLSPAIWTTVATGKSPERHGIPTFGYRDEGRIELYTSGHRQVKAAWNILSGAGQRVHTVGWWNTYPVEEVNGVMVAQTARPGQADVWSAGNLWKGRLQPGVTRQVHPAAREAEFLELAAEVDATLDAELERVYGRIEPEGRLARRLWQSSRWSFAADRAYLRIARQLLAEDADTEVLLLYLGSVDVVSHRFWRHAFASLFEYPPPESEVKLLEQVIPYTYMWMDEALRRLREDRPEATFLVLSDHGFHGVGQDQTFAGDDPGALVSGGHNGGPAGVLIAVGADVEPTADWSRWMRAASVEALPVLGSVHDVLPTLLALRGVSHGADMEGRPLLGLLRPAVREAYRREPRATHDDPEFLAGGAARRAEALALVEGMRALTEERMRQLQELGYVLTGEDED